MDALIDATEETSQEDTAVRLHERMDNIEKLLRVLLLHAEIVSGDLFTEDDLEYKDG